MKTNLKTTLALLLLGAATLTLRAQDDAPPQSPPNQGQQSQNGGTHHRPPPPVILALDANHDGVIDSNEIANASAALKTLDKNGDGKLTRDELRPQRPSTMDGNNSTNQDGVLPPPLGNDQGQGHRHGPPADPVVTALDTNHDGVIDADEIANAPAALKALDKNGDGKLTRDELRPSRPQGGNAGGPEGEGRPPGRPDDGVPPPQN